MVTEVMAVFIDLIVVKSIHNVCVYQAIMLYILHIYIFLFVSYTSVKLGRKKIDSSVGSHAESEVQP